LPKRLPPTESRVGKEGRKEEEVGGQVTTPIDEFGDFAALDPFFRIIEQGLAGFVDGGHFFDLLAEDVIVGSNIILRSADGLAVHRDREASVIVLEYAVHGQAVQKVTPSPN
jgi:hypothetical protein